MIMIKVQCFYLLFTFKNEITFNLEIVISVAIKTVIGYQMSLGNEQAHQLLLTTKWIQQLFSSFNTLKKGTHLK